MSKLYLDTSALGRVLNRESAVTVVMEEIDRAEACLSSRLLRTELCRVALRENRLEFIEQLLADVSLVPIDESTLIAAETIRPGSVRALDAIHLATAVRLAADGVIDAVMTYDKRLAEAMRHHGLEVVAPA
jgi:predicted nucleic acid-binding protein